jgi:hypothetical protein
LARFGADVSGFRRCVSWDCGASGVIIYMLPWIGLELLETARAVADFDLPMGMLVGQPVTQAVPRNGPQQALSFLTDI